MPGFMGPPGLKGDTGLPGSKGDIGLQGNIQSLAQITVQFHLSTMRNCICFIPNCLKSSTWLKPSILLTQNYKFFNGIRSFITLKDSNLAD